MTWGTLIVPTTPLPQPAAPKPKESWWITKSRDGFQREAQTRAPGMSHDADLQDLLRRKRSGARLDD